MLQAPQESGEVTTPGSVQKAKYFGLMDAVLSDRRLDWMILEVSSNLSNSTLLPETKCVP